MNTKEAKHFFVDARFNVIGKNIKDRFMSSGVILINNEIKVIRSLENRGILLKKISSQKDDFLIFLGY